MNKIEAVVFDMDGLMFDTERLWLNSVKRTNEVYGYNVPEELIIECMGKRKDYIDIKLKEVLGNDFDTVEFRKLNVKYMNEDVEKNGLKIKKGLIELLDFLKLHNIKMAVASSSSYETISKRFKEANLSIEYFECIIGGDMVKEPKPSPQIYLKSCEVLGIKPENAIALEDSDYGIMSAHNAGMKAILIPDIKNPAKEILEITYKKLEDLLQVINLFDFNTKIKGN